MSLVNRIFTLFRLASIFIIFDIQRITGRESTRQHLNEGVSKFTTVSRRTNGEKTEWATPP